MAINEYKYLFFTLFLLQNVIELWPPEVILVVKQGL